MEPVIATKVGNRIRLSSGAHIPGLKNTIPGAGMIKSGQWSIPLTTTACLLLRERFGARLRIDRSLGDWYRAEAGAGVRMAALGARADAELVRVPELAPDLSAAFSARTYQRVGARFIAEGRRVLLADEMGLGKTLQAIGGVLESGVPGPYLVVAPKTATEAVWGRELLRWLDDGYVATFPDGRAARERVWNELDGLASPLYATLWVVVHPEMARVRSWWVCRECGSETPMANVKKLQCEKDANGNWFGHDPRRSDTRHDREWPQLFNREWGAIINDESQRSLLRRRKTPTQVRNGMLQLQVRENGLKIASTGTPFKSRGELLWGTLNWLRPDLYTAFWSWAETYYEVGTDGYGRTIGRLKPSMEQILWRSLDALVLRRTKAEVAPDLPPKTYVGTPLGDDEGAATHGVWLPMEGEQAKVYRQMFDDSVAALEGGDLPALGVLAELTRLKQFASASGRVAGRTEDGRPIFQPEMPSNKIDYITQMLDEMGYPESPTGKIVIISQFTKLLELVREALSRHFSWGINDKRICAITGDVSQVQRDRIVPAFNERGTGPHIMLLQTKTGGVAITIDSADHMVFLDETWVPDDQEQAEDRIHRVSNPRPVFYHYLRSLGSIDSAIAEANAELEEGGKRLLDERRGIEFSKRVVELARKGA
jgi:SNF2 family DNA or RNA helicase